MFPGSSVPDALYSMVKKKIHSNFDFYIFKTHTEEEKFTKQEFMKNLSNRLHLIKHVHNI